MSSFMAMLFLALIGYFIFRIFKPAKQEPKLCTACLTTASPKIATKGSIWIEIVLWICFIVPGVIYSLWRLSSKQNACPACGNKELIPVTSPRALQLLSQASK